MSRYFWEEDPHNGYRPIDQAVAHIVIAYADTETPGGTDATEYLAACGDFHCGYGFVYLPTVTVSGSLVDIRKLGIRICPLCAEIVEKLGYAPDGSDYCSCCATGGVGLLSGAAEAKKYLRPAHGV